MKIKIELIDYFHKALAQDKNNAVDFKKMNAKSAPLGYLIHPDCCTKEVWDWLDTLTTDYNATFYKDWNDVISKNRFELFIDQILHYSTTYGTDFQMEGNGYVPNDGSTSPNFKELKVIEPISEHDLRTKCLDVLKSGIALKSSTMTVLCDFVIQFGEIPINDIRNREAQCYISNELGIYPQDEFSILRCLVSKYTGSPMIIKDKKTLTRIRDNASSFDNLGKENPILKLTEDNITRLSRIFLRFKPIFLSMKTEKTAKVINRIRRLAKSNHTPLKAGFWENLVSTKHTLKEIKAKIDEISNFKKIRLLQCVNVALDSQEKSKVYVIRNGKSYVRQNYAPKYDVKYLEGVRKILRDSLVKFLKGKKCNVKYPSDISITLPSSEKSFVGNYPLGSSIGIGNEDGVVGIHWKGSDGTQDFDLSMVDFSGNLIAWRGDFYNKEKSIVFSGDMTSANPCATELMYFKKECPDSLVCVNQFRGNPKSKFRIFVAREKIDCSKDIRNYMVNPNNIRFETMVDVDGQTQKSVGVVHDGRFYLMDLHSGNRIVSNGNAWNLAFINTMVERAKCFVDLKEILTLAGFKFVEEDPDIDFTKMEKDTLIKLLSQPLADESVSLQVDEINSPLVC